LKITFLLAEMLFLALPARKWSGSRRASEHYTGCLLIGSLSYWRENERLPGSQRLHSPWRGHRICCLAQDLGFARLKIIIRQDRKTGYAEVLRDKWQPSWWTAQGLLWKNWTAEVTIIREMLCKVNLMECVPFHTLSCPTPLPTPCFKRSVMHRLNFLECCRVLQEDTSNSIYMSFGRQSQENSGHVLERRSVNHLRTQSHGALVRLV